MSSEAARAPLIVAFSDAAYLPLLTVWVRQVRALGAGRLRIYCLDEPTAQWCAVNDVDHERLQWSGRLDELWAERIRVFTDLLRMGQSFVHSDIDAIWLRNPLREGTAAACDCDLVFSQGTVWPPDVHEQWGFVLCCGWFRARASAAAVEFFETLRIDVAHTGDDQISVNRVLAARQPCWSAGKQGEYRFPFRDRWVQCWTHAVQARAGSLTVALLPHQEFQRLPEDYAGAVVKHFLTPKNCQQKMSLLSAAGLL
jgi:hypothetical protein